MAKTTPFSFSNTKSGRGVLLWDGFGLQDASSGIFRHIHALYASICTNSEWQPNILIPEQWRVPLIAAGFHRDHLCSFPAHWAIQNKVLWNFRTAGYIRCLRDEDCAIIYHGFSNYNLPFFSNLQIKSVLTIHDLIPFQFPSTVSKAYRIQFEFLLKRALRHCPSLCFVSSSTRRAFFEYFPHYHGDYKVIENGIETRNYQEFKKKRQVIFVGRSESYKRLPFAIDVMQSLPTDIRKVVVTDAKGANLIDHLWASKESRPRVFVDISHDNLNALLTESSVLLFTSVVEGFGLPLVEALVANCAIVCSPKVGISDKLDASVAVFPKQAECVELWCEAIEQALILGQSPEFISHKNICLRTFSSWKDTAHEISQLYDRLVS